MPPAEGAPVAEVALALEQLWRLGVALGIGLMIGLERGWTQREAPAGSRIAGFRTFTLIALYGGLVALLGQLAGLWLLAVALLPLTALLLLAQHDELRERPEDRGITTLVAALIAFALGALAVLGEPAVAAAAGVVVTLLLGFKLELHGLLERLDRRELNAVLKLLVMSLVLLPLLPDRGFGPWGALNPHRLWWMVVLVAGLSSAGYFAIRLLGGTRGLLLTALLGGLASSTATTVALARRAKGRPELAGRHAGAALVAGAIVAPRLALLVAVVAPGLLPAIAWPLAGLGLGCLVMALVFWHQRGAPAGQAIALGNPFELGPALKLGLILALVMLLSEALPRWLGESGLFALAAIAGLTDVDAIALSYGTQATVGHLAPSLALWGILTAVGVNALVKAAIGWSLGGGAVGWRLVAGHLGSLACAAAGLLLGD